ncbi:small multi-drug export protein [Candidatus Pacearchaeota archaeon]|nr:small multi-drug export protein [Candidatus Pacearchaeota archaeon]
MDLKLLWAVILTIMPVTELRVGLPVAILYAIEQNIPIWLIFSLIVLLNVLIIFFIFYFLDHIHHVFLKFNPYKKLFEKYVGKFQKKVDKFEKKYETLGFLALVLFVAVPLPGTGAWTGCLLSWLVGLDRKKSILAISIGVLMAGLFILFGTLGFLSFL